MVSLIGQIVVGNYNQEPEWIFVSKFRFWIIYIYIYLHRLLLIGLFFTVGENCNKKKCIMIIIEAKYKS